LSCSSRLDSAQTLRAIVAKGAMPPGEVIANAEEAWENIRILQVRSMPDRKGAATGKNV
jgi:hypothetical protein